MIMKIELTKELREDTHKEAQIARDIVRHCRRKRFDNGVNAEHPLKKLQFHENKVIFKYIRVHFICVKTRSKREGIH